MEQFTIKKGQVLYPRNAGQQVQADLRAMFGQSPKADNQKAGADIIINGRGYQVKSARATVCHGWTIENVRTEYAGVDGFIFADVQTSQAYVMTVDEFVAFAGRFAERTSESNKNGGRQKLRLNRQIAEQRKWLAGE